jgi:hypothetical protein
MKDFKKVVLESTLEDVATYCANQAIELGCSESEIGAKAIDAIGTFYCPDDATAARFGFLTETELNGDCAEIAADSGVKTGDVIDELHKSYSESRFGEGFYGNQIIFVDLNALAESFATELV